MLQAKTGDILSLFGRLFGSNQVQQQQQGMFGRLFGLSHSKKKVAASPLNDSIQQLRQGITEIERREKDIDKKIQACLNNARAKSKRRDKKGALYELERNRLLQNQLQSLQGKRLELETQCMVLEDANLNKQSLKVI